MDGEGRNVTGGGPEGLCRWRYGLAINRIYYACFYAASAVLLRNYLKRWFSATIMTGIKQGAMDGQA